MSPVRCIGLGVRDWTQLKLIFNFSCRQNECDEPREQAEALHPWASRLWSVCLSLSAFVCLFYAWIMPFLCSSYKPFSGVAAGSVAIFFTSEWIGKNLLQFVPVYNRLEFGKSFLFNISFSSSGNTPATRRETCENSQNCLWWIVVNCSSQEMCELLSHIVWRAARVS